MEDANRHHLDHKVNCHLVPEKVTFRVSLLFFHLKSVTLLFFHLIGIVVSCVVKIMTDGRGQHDEQVDAVHLTPQVSQPDQPVHLSRHRRKDGE